MRHDRPVRLNGAEVRRLWHAQHLTQHALAVAVGRYQPDISDMELGRLAHVQPATLARLSDVLGVAMEDLVGEEER